VTFSWLPVAMGQYVETTRGCLSCHESQQSRSDFCDAVPASVWRMDDKHRRAFTLLHEADSPDVAKRARKQTLVRQILGFELREAFADDQYSRLIDATKDEARQRVATVKACLRCHGTWPKEADERFVNAPPVPLELGVSCQACHGPGERWFLVHISEGWRRVTPEAKASLGCADCRSPVAKAKLCASCHVGNVAEEKFVKHEWYAAGHPPLPSFELASFEAQMPAHWKSLREKAFFKYRDVPSTGPEALPLDQRGALERAGVPAEAIKGSYVEANFADAIQRGLQPVNDLTALKDVVLGGTTVYAEAVKSLADYAALATENRASWPELALYDCAGCHHELRSGLGVQSRPKRNHAPGRPPLAAWPQTLSRLAATQTNDNTDIVSWPDIQVLINKLDQAATLRPFGEATAIKAAANELQLALARNISEATLTRFDEQGARRAVELLVMSRGDEVADFYSARQMAWAISAIVNDLAPGQGRTMFLQSTEDPLALRLPAGPNQSVIDNLPRWLSAAGRYEPDWFRDQLKSLRLP
jgi:hypothetical protein